jgi:hypothetical protein
MAENLLTRREAIGGGTTALALWASSQIAAAQSSAVYPADVCTVVSDVAPQNEPEVDDEGCKLFLQVDSGGGNDQFYITVKGQSGWDSVDPAAGSSPWSDTDGDGLLELPNDDGVDISEGKVRTAPSSSDDIARKDDLDGKADTSHDLGGSEHAADTLADLNSKVSDATLDDQGDTRPPEAHDHQGDTLRPAELLGVDREQITATGQTEYLDANGDEFRVRTAGDLEVIESSKTNQVVAATSHRGPTLALSSAITSSTTVSDRSKVVQVDTSPFGGTITITLGNNLEIDGLPVIVNDVGGDASTQNIDIEAQSGKNIDGQQTITIANDYQSIVFYYSDTESQWFTGPVSL